MIVFAFVLDGDKTPANQESFVDEYLIYKIGKGDMTAFDKFYRDTERTLYAYLLSLTQNHDIALDIMQDTYVKLISAAHLYKPMGKPLAWIFTIGKNLFYSSVKKYKREIKIDPFEISNSKDFSYSFDSEDKLVLEAVLKLLSEQEREIVMLYAVSGLKHREIAEELGLKLSTTLSKYHRALKKLRNYLQGKELK